MLRSYQDKDDWNAIDPNLVLDGDRAWPINGSVKRPSSSGTATTGTCSCRPIAAAAAPTSPLRTVRLRSDSSRAGLDGHTALPVS